MKISQPALTVTVLSSFALSTSGFTFVPKTSRTSIKNAVLSPLQMGIFDSIDGEKPGGMSEIDAERETPIDRWMGWSTKEGGDDKQVERKVDANFIDSMDPANYVAAELSKPMGIVFEENADDKFLGVFVVSVEEGGEAATNGVIQPGDQLVSVGTSKVTGMTFDNAVGAIVDSPAEKTKLVLFRGPAKQFYGPTGASQAWVDEFVAAGGVDA